MVVIATHLIEEVSTLLQDVVIIDHGRLVLQDDAERLRAGSGASLQDVFVQLTEPSGDPRPPARWRSPSPGASR
jgi:ABC-type multidrug transport system ATPase subunit